MDEKYKAPEEIWCVHTHRLISAPTAEEAARRYHAFVALTPGSETEITVYHYGCLGHDEEVGTYELRMTAVGKLETTLVDDFERVEQGEDLY